MSPFERFGINHLSASSINLYCSNPRLWVGRYLMGWKDDAGPSAWRGTAVEAGLDAHLFGGKPFEAAQEKFDELCGGALTDKTEDERSNIADMLRIAMQSVDRLGGAPLGRQIKIDLSLPGIEVPLIGYVDYAFETCDIDLKSTLKAPSGIKSDHGRQGALYQAARGRPFEFLYVTPKKSMLLPLTGNEAGMHMGDLSSAAHSIRHLLSRSESPLDAMRFFGLNRDDFRWSQRTLELATA